MFRYDPGCLFRLVYLDVTPLPEKEQGKRTGGTSIHLTFALCELGLRIPDTGKNRFAESFSGILRRKFSNERPRFFGGLAVVVVNEEAVLQFFFQFNTHRFRAVGK